MVYCVHDIYIYIIIKTTVTLKRQQLFISSALSPFYFTIHYEVTIIYYCYCNYYLICGVRDLLLYCNNNNNNTKIPLI